MILWRNESSPAEMTHDKKDEKHSREAESVAGIIFRGKEDC